MKKKYAIRSGMLILILLLINTNIIAQSKVKEVKKFSDKIFFGGSVGMVFGSVTRVDILPHVGMWVLPQWAIGVGGRYTFRKENYSIIGGESKPYKAHIWGVSGFTQIMPFPDLDKAFKIGIHGGPILQGEWEGLYLDKGVINPTLPNKGKGWVHLILVGAGYHFPIGEKAGINILAMWDLTNSQYSPYTSNPMLRISISF
mgnify:CR=1 FL=1